MLYVLMAVLALVVAGALAWPLLRRRDRPRDRRSFDLALYRAQLAELETERAQGTIADEEAAAARTEVERRLLRAADRAPVEPQAAPMGRGGRRAVAAVTAAFMLGLAALLYARLGSPDEPDEPAVREADVPADQASPEELAVRLDAMLQTRPDQLRGWLMLGPLASSIGRWDLAVDAYRHATRLQPGEVAHWVGLGQAYAGREAGLVTAPARDAFEKALKLSPDNPVARFYLGLADFQAHDDQAAYDRWLSLAHDTPPDAGWAEMLGRNLDRAARHLGEPEPHLFAAAPEAGPPAAPGPSAAQMQAAGSMSASDRGAMIQGMVQRLADRLKDHPDDLDGWLRLGRAYTVLQQPEKAADAYRNALRLDPGNQQAKQALAALKGG